MTDAKQIQEILSQYEKHGWSLRRVLLSDAAKKDLSGATEDIFGAAEIISSDLNAAWFSRSSGVNGEAWELRRLGGTPFALIEVFNSDDDEENQEIARQDMQTRLRELSSKNTNRELSENS